MKQLTFNSPKSRRNKNETIETRKQEASNEGLKHVNSGKTLSYEKACNIHRSISPEQETEEIVS